jgi:hypothetical protein
MGGFSAQVQQGNNQLSGGGKSGQMPAPMSGSPGQNEKINDFLAQFRQPDRPIGSPQQVIPNAPTMPDGTMGAGTSAPLQGANGVITNPATSGQPQMGMPNQYPNTVGMGDNSRNITANTGGKGKGA